MENDSEDSSEGSEFVATSEMLTYAYDDESTINEDEDLADDNEVDDLRLESDMPLEELLLKYAPQLKCSDLQSEDYQGNTSSKRDVCTNAVAIESKSLVEPSDCTEPPCLLKIDQCDDEDTHVVRGSTRLWCKALIDNNSNYDSEDDGDYIPDIDLKLFSNAQIRIGENYQALTISVVNIQTPNDYYYSCKDREILLWKALNDSDRFLSDLKLYMKEYGKISGQVALNSTNIDDATALFSLMEHDYDVTSALMFLKNKPVRPSDLPNIMQSWTEQEVLEFEKGFETHYKNFRLIREQRLRTRTVAEIVEFYYFWKKTARYDGVIRWCKRDKKKQINQITDYIDCLAPENNGRKENCLLGNWPGTKVDNEILQLPEEAQSAKYLNNILLRNGTEFESVLGGDWNMTSSSLSSRHKESSDTTSTDDKLSDEVRPVTIVDTATPTHSKSSK